MALSSEELLTVFSATVTVTGDYCGVHREFPVVSGEKECAECSEGYEKAGWLMLLLK